MSLCVLFVLFSPFGNAVFDQAAVVREKAEQMGVISHFVLFGLFLSFLHSLLEEYYWRWFVFGNLHRFLNSKSLAYGVGALGFASHHIVVTTQFFDGPIGWIYGLTVGRSGGNLVLADGASPIIDRSMGVLILLWILLSCR